VQQIQGRFLEGKYVTEQHFDDAPPVQSHPRYIPVSGIPDFSDTGFAHTTPPDKTIKAGHDRVSGTASTGSMSMKSICKMALAGVSLAALVAPAQASAQTAAPKPAAPPAASSAGAEDIIVTARRKDESVQDVPAVVNAVTAEDIAKLNLRKFEDVTSLVPGLSLAANANGIGVTATVRGVNYDVNVSGNNGTIEFYTNDAPVPAGSVFNSLFDIGQIEVLRGPQGTLKGRSSPSGSITLLTHRPNLAEIGGNVNATVTSIKGYNTNGAINIPIVKDKFGVRIAGVVAKDEGNRVHDLVNTLTPSNKTEGIRASAEGDPFEGVLVLDFTYQSLLRRASQFAQAESVNQLISTAAASPVTIAAKSRLGVIGLSQDNRQQFTFYNWQGKLSLAGQQLTYVGSRNTQHLESLAPTDIAGVFTNDFSGANQFAQPTDTRSTGVSHELRLQNQERIAGIFDYVIGALNNKASSDTFLKSVTGIALGAPFSNPPRLVNVVLTPVERYGNNTEKSYFGNLTAHLGDAVELSGGLRHIKYHNIAGLRVGNPLVENPLFFQNQNQSKTIYQATAKYNINQDAMVYASTGTSWRPSTIAIGGPTGGLSPLQLSYLSTDPETSKSIEVGTKSAFLDRTVHVNLTAYQQKFKNYPYRSPSGIFAIDRTNATNPSVVAFNYEAAVPVKVTGAEAELSYRPNENFSVGTIISYAKGKITNGLVPCLDLNSDGIADVVTTPPTLAQLQAVVGTTNISSCRVNINSSLSARWSGSLQSEYSHPLSENINGYVRGLFSYRGNSQNDPLNAFDNIKSYGLLNLFLGVRSPDNGWELALYGKNVANTFRVLTRSNGPQATPLRGGIPLGGPVFSSGSLSTTNYYGITVTEPREFGVSLKIAFGSR
jgi:iron complex outermembrane recepter protein